MTLRPFKKITIGYTFVMIVIRRKASLTREYSSAILLASWLCMFPYFTAAEISSPAPPIKPTGKPLLEPISKSLSVVLSPNTINDTRLFLAGRSIQKLNTYSGKHTRRDVASYILMQQALYKGGYTGDFKEHPEMAYLRNLRYVADGKVALLGETIWLDDVKKDNDKYFISSEVIRDGEFVVGLYVNPDHPLSSTQPSAKQLEHYSAASNRNWKADWQVLRDLNVKSIQHSLFWRNIVKMVHAGRADFTLAPFQDSPDLGIAAYGLTLAVVPDVKVALTGSRHFIVSRKHPMGKTIFEQLERGLKILRQEGTITRAFTEVGFFNQKTKHWQLLNPPKNPQVSITTSGHQVSGSQHKDHPPQSLQPL